MDFSSLFLIPFLSLFLHPFLLQILFSHSPFPSSSSFSNQISSLPFLPSFSSFFRKSSSFIPPFLLVLFSFFSSLCHVPPFPLLQFPSSFLSTSRLPATPPFSRSIYSLFNPDSIFSCLFRFLLSIFYSLSFMLSLIPSHLPSSPSPNLSPSYNPVYSPPSTPSPFFIPSLPTLSSPIASFSSSSSSPYPLSSFLLSL